MGNNIIKAITNIVNFGNYDLKDYASKSHIRINAVGEQLEFFVKDSIANSFNVEKEKKEAEYSKIFSWLGNQNHPPDIIIKNSDAFEIKKIENQKSSLALNSSPPKDKLLASDVRITKDCKNCEVNGWNEKELFYVIGHTKSSKLRYIFFIHATCYAARHEVYHKVHDPIKSKVDSVLDSLGLEKGKTIEIGKVKRVDPLGITELRIRGMWQIQNPLKVYESSCKISDKDKFHLFALLRKEKYDSFPKEDTKELENHPEIHVKDIKIKDPNNPANLIEAKLITSVEK